MYRQNLVGIMVNKSTAQSLPEKYKKSREKILFYEKIFSSLNAIVFMFDLNNYKMLWVNNSFKKILGYKKSMRSIPEEEMLDVYHPDDRDVLREMRNFFRQNKSASFTALFKFRDVNNNYLWLCTVANIFRRTNDESVFEVVGVSIDFTSQFTYSKNIRMLSREKLREMNQDVIAKITPREREILQYFAAGCKTREIAEKFNLSFHTVNNHRKNLLKKLEIKNLAALVNFAVENGLD